MELEQKKEVLKQKIRSLYPNDYEKIFDEISETSDRFLRLTNKSDIDTLAHLEADGIILSLTNFPKVYSFKETEKRISETEAFKDGKIYIQELSSMLPVLEMTELPEKNQIIDLCASPGSKLTQAFDALPDSKFTAVELEPKRFKNLAEVVDKYTDSSILLLQGDARKIIINHPYLENTFDIVMLDAPCSSEGKIMLSDNSIEYWNTKKVKAYSKIQKGLINQAISLLKPGGYLLYSTCTYSFQENERVVNWVLEKFPELELEPFRSYEILNFTPNVPGLLSYQEENVSDAISKTLRILPIDGFSAFYMAKIRKAE